MSPRDLDPIVEDLKRFLAQQAAQGITRVFVDPQVVSDAARAARARSARALGAGGSESVQSVAGGAEAGTMPVSAGDASPARQGRRKAALEESAEQARARKAKQLDELDRREVRGCAQCKLHRTRTQTVFGVGNPNANLVFVGEAPGRDEDLQGEPFVGAAGQLLTKILAAIGFSRDDVYICNVLKCRPPDNRDPEADEVNACEPYLLRQLEIIQPKLICALGRHAATTLLGTTSSLAKMRQHVHDYHGIPLVVTYHPAALLRNPQWKRPTWEDVQKLRALHDRLVAQG